MLTTVQLAFHGWMRNFCFDSSLDGLQFISGGVTVQTSRSVKHVFSSAGSVKCFEVFHLFKAYMYGRRERPFLMPLSQHHEFILFVTLT